jgi:transposase-like protein
MSIMETMERKQPRARRSFTPAFKAEIVESCQRGDRSIGQVARDFDLTETAVRGWVRQAERDAKSCRPFAGRTNGSGKRGDPQASDGFLREGDPVNVYPFIEAEKAQQRNARAGV